MDQLMNDQLIEVSESGLLSDIEIIFKDTHKEIKMNLHRIILFLENFLFRQDVQWIF